MNTIDELERLNGIAGDANREMSAMLKTLIGREVLIDKGGSERFVNVLRAVGDRLYVQNPATGKEYWVCWSFVRRVAAEVTHGE